MDDDDSLSQTQMHSMLPTDDIPEDSEPISIPEDSGQVYMPPPRIAARFYRPQNPRRKSSAASSRRNSINSISSAHSHQSNRSYRTNCQSNHVAQHLRRASIIESRKARLADRAAHAEQVRLRAALAKAAPRTSNSEERALAAQQAREKHLAQIAAACTREVQRAKKVAEEMKERKAAEERRNRLEMEERLAEAEKRRLEYQRNMRRPRTSSSPSQEARKPTIVTHSALDADSAAKCIQMAWRRRRRRKIFEAFSDLGLSIDKVHDTSFEKISELLSEERVLSLTTKVLEVLNISNNKEESSKNTPQTGTRRFLSAYLILGHPTTVFNSDGAQEQDLITKAKDLMICFEECLSKSVFSSRYMPDATLLETLSLTHSAYITAFDDWKARDSSTLVETMVASFVNLDAIWQSVKDDRDGEVANDYREGIRENQVILLSKIRKLAGPDRANMLIKKAIRESRRTRARRKPVGDVRPRVAVESLGSPAENPEASVAASVQATSRLSQDASSEEGSQSSALTKIFSVVPPNRILVHELAIDKEYRIDISPTSDIRDAVNREVCNAMRRGFEQGEGDAWTVAMAQNIRSKLLHLLRAGNSLHSIISEALEPEFIQRQCVQGVFSYEKFFSFMASILPKLCAPFRDAQVKALAEELEELGDLGSMIDKLFKLLHVIDLLSLDYSNFLLVTAAPTLIKESAGYEQRMFAEDIGKGRVTLNKTKHWWRNASVNVLTEADRQDPTHRPTTQKIYARGLVDLAISTSRVRDEDIPETLELDKARFARVRADALRITTIGAILLTAKNLLKRDVRTRWQAEAGRIWDALLKSEDKLLSSPDTNPPSNMPGKTLSIIESSHALPPATKIQLSNTIARLLQQAESGRLTDPVMKVLFQRLKTHIFNRVSASSSGERVRAASDASEGLASSGLPEFGVQAGEIVECLGKVSEVDKKAHGTWYEGIAREVEALGLEEQDGREAFA